MGWGSQLGQGPRLLQAQAASLAAVMTYLLTMATMTCLICWMFCYRPQLLLLVVQPVSTRHLAALLVVVQLVLLLVVVGLKGQQAMQQQEGLLGLQQGAGGGSSQLGCRLRCGATCLARASSFAF